MKAWQLAIGLTISLGIPWRVAAQTQPPPKLPADHAAQMAKGLDLFKKHVKPILMENCIRCHGGGLSLEAELDLSDRDGAVKGGQSGPALVPGKAKGSLLVKLISHAREPHMPRKAKKLPDAAIAHITSWIDLGAPYDAPLVAGKRKAPSWTERVVDAEARQFWSFQPLRRATPPVVKDETWCRTLIDRFILAKLEGAGIKPNPLADKQQLIRRAYFDVIGLPPPPEELHRFLSDTSPDAYGKMLDRLLASPHYGERWARHWLDLARFAESHGFEHDYDRPSAYHYRDFVIEALNRDLPYDTFVKWQIAGDEYEPDNPLALKATGFLAAGVHSTQITKNEVEKHRYDEMDDKLHTIGTAMLGLTFGCARCHDHKFDPIPQRDYYRMVSTFTTTVRSEVELKPLPDDYVKAKAAFDRAHTPLVDELRRFEKTLPDRLAAWEKEQADKAKVPGAVAALLKIPSEQRNAEQRAQLLKWYRDVDAEFKKLERRVLEHAKKAPPLPKMLIATEGLSAVRLHTQGEDFLPVTHFLRRGDVDQKESVAEQGFLQVLMPDADSGKRWQTQPPKGWRTSYRRRALAEWVSDVDKGGGMLLARVIVNRLWQHHIGRGLVATPSDFGARGEPPTHPELLDWLAAELIKGGWKLKPIHKLILTSAVYRQTTQFDEARAKVDRDNKLCWRHPPRRLEAEVIRDSLLAVSGALDPKLYGPGTLDENSRRRSIYFTVKRSKLVPMMTIFDAPDALGGIGERPTTTIAPQALALMNSPQVRSWAKSFAKRIAPDDKTSLEDAIKAGYRTALSRPPQRDELAESLAFVRQQIETYPMAADRRERALADFCQVLMCLNEFVYVD